LTPRTGAAHEAHAPGLARVVVGDEEQGAHDAAVVVGAVALGQGLRLTVDVDLKRLEKEGLDAIRKPFDEEHTRLFTFALPR
jgi:hypothetical protein